MFSLYCHFWCFARKACDGLSLLDVCSPFPTFLKPTQITNTVVKKLSETFTSPIMILLNSSVVSEAVLYNTETNSDTYSDTFNFTKLVNYFKKC